MKKNIFIFLLLFFPLISSAGFIETGPTCSPDLLEDAGDVESLEYATCPWCENEGSTELQLSWELDSREFNDSVCWVGCTRHSGSCIGAFRKDGDNIGGLFTQENNDFNMKPRDFVYITDATPGNQYGVACCERCTEGMRERGECESLPIPFCKQDTLINSIPAKVENECREPCEVPFEEIKDNLYLYQMSPGASPVTITEESFGSWSALDNLDKCLLDESGQCDPWLSKGSGDGTDIKVAMTLNQSCYSNTPRQWNENVLDILGEYLNKGYPVVLVVRNYNSTFSHAVIATDQRWVIRDTSSPYADAKIDFLDPNGPRTGTIDCYYNPDAQNTSLDDQRYTCNFPGDGFLSFDEDVWLEIYTSSGVYSLVREYETICTQQINKNKGICKRTPASRLKEDYPNISNTENDTVIPNDNNGTCFGWTEFVLRVAYLGDFVGHDYHPDDGKYVGVDCDENHYPIQNKSNMRIPSLLDRLRSSISDTKPFMASAYYSMNDFGWWKL